MVHFLSFPYEVRAQILGYATGYFADAPTEVETEQRYAKDLDSKPRFSRERTISPDLSLLGKSSIYHINKQIRQEVLAIAGPVEYHLDLVVLNQGAGLIPTWTYFSRISNEIDVVKCTIRLHGKFNASTRHASLHGGDGGPPPFIWTFYDLMTNFFKHGPKLQESPQSSDDSNHKIKKLIINIESPEPDEETTWWRPRPYGGQDMDAYVDNFRLDPKWFYGFLSSHMGYLLACDYHTGSYGAILYTHVGQIEFRYNGEFKKSHDLDANLIKCKNSEHPNDYHQQTVYPYQLRIYYIQQMWVPLAQRLRRDRNLRVLAPRDPKDNPDGLAGIDFAYYKTWNECYEIVQRTRPETR